MNLKRKYIIIGLVAILGGIQMYITGWSSRLGGHILPSTAILIGLFGVVIIFFTLVTKGHKNRNFMICEKCKKKYKIEYVQIPVCPTCDGKLVAYKEVDQ